MKYVAGIITGVIGGSLLSVGLYMAYRKHKLIDDLTIVRVRKGDTTQDNHVDVDPGNFFVNIDSKTLVEYVDNPFNGVNTFPLDSGTIFYKREYDMEIEGYGNEYLITFKNGYGAGEFISSLYK
jgi:hypothetical protein